MAGLYLPLDVDYFDDEQFIEAGPMAELLYIRGNCFIKRKMLDGKIKRAHLSIIGRGIPNVAKHAQRLVEVGRWRATSEGWTVPAYLKRNPSKAEVEAGQELAREAGVRGNHERWHVGPEGKPSPKCPLCRREAIGSPDRGANRVGSPMTKTETEPKTETDTETSESTQHAYVGSDERRDVGKVLKGMFSTVEEAAS